MIPRVHDVLGVPLPGTTGVLPASPVGKDFRRLLDQLLSPGPQAPAPSSALRRLPDPQGTERPAAPVRTWVPRPRGTAPSRLGSTGAPAVPPRITRPGRAEVKHDVASAIRRAAVTAGVEPALSVAVARAESSLNPAARSPDGQSVGTFQVLPTTAAEMRRKFAAGVVDRPQGSDDVALGVGYLRYLHDLFARNARLGHGRATVAVPDPAERQLFAVAAFNAGEGRVAEAQARAAGAGGDPARYADVQRFLPTITRGYVAKVAGYAIEEGGGPGTYVRA